MLSFPTWNTASKPYNRQFMPSPSLVPVRCSRQWCEDCKSGSHKLNTLTDMACLQRLASLLSLVWGSSAEADVDIQWTQRDVQNDDKRWLVWLSEVFCGFLSHERQDNGHQYKCYRTQYFACVLQYISNINIIYISLYTYKHFCNMKPYDGCKMKTI